MARVATNGKAGVEAGSSLSSARRTALRAGHLGRRRPFSVVPLVWKRHPFDRGGTVARQGLRHGGVGAAGGDGVFYNLRILHPLSQPIARVLAGSSLLRPALHPDSAAGGGGRPTDACVL